MASLNYIIRKKPQQSDDLLWPLIYHTLAMEGRKNLIGRNFQQNQWEGLAIYCDWVGVTGKEREGKL